MEQNHHEYALKMLIRLLDEKRISGSQIKLPFRHMSEVPDHGLRTLLYGSSTVLKESFPDRFIENERMICYALTDSFQCHYFLFPLSKEGMILLFGPYIVGTLSTSTIRDVRRNNRMSPQETDIYRQYTTTLPRVYDAALLEGIFHTFCSFYFGDNCFEIRPWETKMTHPESRFRTPEKPAFRELESRYATETVLMNGISEGDYEKVQAVLGDLSVYGIESRSANLLRDAANYSIIFNTICRISAYRGGAHPQEVDSLSREYSFRIENAAGFDELVQIRNNMVKDYCRLVSTKRPASRSLQVNRAIAYITTHIHEPVMLAKTAEELGITKTYLSAEFRRETGFTFSEYVRNHRLSIAADLLKNTRMSIDEIASYCGINDANYFSRMFRNTYGVSPKHYQALSKTKAEV